MAKQLLSVSTPYGTFTRKTAHVYTHLVIYRLPASEQAASDARSLAAYEAQLARARENLSKVDASGLCLFQGCISSGSYPAQTITYCEPRIAELRARQAAGYKDIWIAYRWSHHLGAAFAGRNELLRTFQNVPNWTLRDAVVCEVATGKVVAL